MNVAIRFARNLFVELLESYFPCLSLSLSDAMTERRGGVGRIGKGWSERVKGETLKRETSRHLSVINFSCPFAFETNFSNYLVSVRGLPATSRERTRVIMARFISRGIHIPRYVSPSREDEEEEEGRWWSSLLISVARTRRTPNNYRTDSCPRKPASLPPLAVGLKRTNGYEYYPGLFQIDRPPCF